MASTKRPRACDACHSIKIKCELGSTGGPGPCERCIRLGKDCKITPAKTQKDRVAELEAQVAALTRLLASQNLGSQSINSTPDEPRSESGLDEPSSCNVSKKKRRLEEVSSYHSESSLLHRLDQIVPPDLQRYLIEKYVNCVVPLVPLVLLPDDWTLEQLRETKPVLFQTIVYSMSTGNLSELDQERLASIVLDTFESLATEENQKSVELIQAIQVAALWYRAPRNHRQVAAFQLAQRAADMAQDIGLWEGAKSSHSALSAVNDDTDPVASLRAWLTCHMISTAIVIQMRKASFKTLGELDTFSLHMLEYLECSRNSDRVLCHFLKAEMLCEQIVTDLNLLDSAVCKDISDLGTQLSIQALQNSIIDWNSQRPMDPVCLSLGIYQHVTVLYLHETVLHTPTNKPSFGAPYLAERLSMTDFPAPIIVTEQHVNSLHTLKDAAHSLMDLVATFDINIWISLPFVLFVGRVAYAEYILMKLYIATTAPGNTFGAFLDSDSLRVGRYLDQMIEISTLAQQVDSTCPAARLLLAPTRMKEWLTKYNITTGLVSASSDYGSKEATPVLSDDVPFTLDNSTLGFDISDWDLNEFLADPSGLDVFSASQS